MMCSILKGGSNSWKVFMQRVADEVQNSNITVNTEENTHSKTDGTEVNESCWPECALTSTKMMQVRHPLERLLSAYRYVFERTNTYEDQFVQIVSLKQLLGDQFKKLSWVQFVDMIIRNKLASHKELVDLEKASGEMGDDGKIEGVEESINSNKDYTVNEPDIWVANHWAPFWYTCGVCLPELRPSYILHMDNLTHDIPALLDRLGMGHLQVEYPHALKGVEGHSSNKVKEYYSQLTKAQVWQLYNLYRVDHELFGFSPREYLDMAF